MIREITAKSILRKHKKIDSWFLSSYAVNFYRGCAHNCVYCDGRYEKYQVEGEFGNDIAVKTNALELLERELDPARKRKSFAGGFMLVCSGVSDSYQPLETKYGLCRKTLELLYKYRHPVHMLTKSTLIERDLDLLQKIDLQRKAIVSFSFSSVDEKISKMLEPGVPSPGHRLETIKKFKEAGICCGMFLMPVVPLITDTHAMIEDTVKAAKEAGVDFIIFGGMTLKEGRQKDHFMAFLKNHFPQYTSAYTQLYAGNNAWGSPPAGYVSSLAKTYDHIATKYGMPKRIPAKVFQSLVSKTELVVIILEQLDYLLKLKGDNSPYGYAAYTLSKITQPVETLSTAELLRLKGIGPVSAGIIREIIETGSCAYYERML